MTMSARRPSQPRQLDLTYRSWGGRRAGAGRKRSAQGGVPHRARPPLASRFPVHVTLRLGPALPSLRHPCCAPAVAHALRTGAARDGFRLIHFCVTSNHLHLLCEATCQRALSAGLRGFSIRLARALNARLQRRGPVLAERYHARILRTPLEVQRALLYVLNNQRRHEREKRSQLAADWADRFSSGPWFDGWRARPHNGRPPPSFMPRPHTWLLRAGWRRHGLLHLAAVPGGAAG